MDEEDAQPRLEQLVLAGNGIGMQGAQAVAAVLPKLTQLQVQFMAFWGDSIEQNLQEGKWTRSLWNSIPLYWLVRNGISKRVYLNPFNEELYNP